MAYLVIAYPDLSSHHFTQLQSYRQKNDDLFTIIEPHFTFVFPMNDIYKVDFVNEIKAKSKAFKKIDFAIRCATVHKDSFSEHFYTFLVPDEGYSSMVKLHDKLYSGNLKDNLRLDIAFVPHIRIGNSIDKNLCKQMVNDWNHTDFLISGTISKLTIVKFENNVVWNIDEVGLE